METIAVLVYKLLNLNAYIESFLDSSDYIGCFDTGYISTRIDLANTDAMKPCECIGFCLTKNFSFAGITHGYINWI